MGGLCDVAAELGVKLLDGVIHKLHVPGRPHTGVCQLSAHDLSEDTKVGPTRDIRSENTKELTLMS